MTLAPDRAPALHLVPGVPGVPDSPAGPFGAGVLGEEVDLDTEVVLRQRIVEARDLVTFVWEPVTRPVGGLLAFRPGQYVTLTAGIGGESVERCYTISSPPTRPHLLTTTVKRVEGGRMSPWLHDRLEVGGRVHLRGPMGDFTVSEHPARRYLLLSAGSGVTPTLSTVRAMADLAALGSLGPGPDGLDVVVLHSARTPDDLPCRTELEALAATHPGLRLVWTVDDVPAQPGAGHAWTGYRGMLTSAVLAATVPDLAQREVMLCGPDGYRAAVRSMLAELGADLTRCHEESFVVAEAVAPEAVEGAAGATVRFGRSGREVHCAPGTTVLDAARQAGVRLPSSCASGLCGTCKSTLLSGRVDMRHQGGIRPREIAQDRFLPCCSVPDGDIVVDA